MRRSDDTRRQFARNKPKRRGDETVWRKKNVLFIGSDCKRNSRIYVGHSIVRKTESRENKDEDIVVCLPVARVEHVTEIIQQIYLFIKYI